MPSNIELGHLETFLVVVEEMNFGRAGSLASAVVYMLL